MSSTPYITGYNSREQADICVNHCDHPDKCITDGDVYPQKRRCALERLLDDQYQPKQEMPPGYLTMRQAARQVGICYETMRKRVLAGKYPEAKRIGSGSTAPWAIPADALRKHDRQTGTNGTGKAEKRAMHMRLEGA